MPVPFAGKEFTFHNPDGSEVRVRGWGDQFAAVFETFDGYTVVRDSDTGFYHYAAPSEDREALVATGTRVGAVDPRTLGVPQHLRMPRESTRARAQAAHDAAGPRRRWEVRREQRRSRQQRPAGDGDGHSGVLSEPEAAANTGVRVGLCLMDGEADHPEAGPDRRSRRG